jgi:hypothetical protein
MVFDHEVKLYRLMYHTFIVIANASVTTLNTEYHLMVAAQEEQRCVDGSPCRLG